MSLRAARRPSAAVSVSGLARGCLAPLMGYLPKACCCPGERDEGPDRRKHSGKESVEILARVTCGMYSSLP